MNVLWITNILLPDAVYMLSGQRDFRETGGWMVGAANMLATRGDVRLSVATVSDRVMDLTTLNVRKITYYIIPKAKGRGLYDMGYESYWTAVAQKAKPDVVHIHGTEYSYGLAYVRACGSDNVVVSIQGMKSVYSRYYTFGLESEYHGRLLTFHDMLTGGLNHEKELFRQSGEYEKELIGSVRHVIGRTSWDHDHVLAINPDIVYHFCNETLRPEFYSSVKWSYCNCVKHSIFVSQATYPIKGFHQLLKAMPIVLRYYPDAVVRVSGKDIRISGGLYDRLYYGGYSKIVKSIIKRLSLQNNVTFLGGMTASEMIGEYLRSNVFVCPSSIENSPNSLGEAQILGVPCVASYVGGIPDMMKGDEEHLYRFEETEMLAFKICKVFSDGDKQTDMSAAALSRHNPQMNADRLMDIYASI